MRETPIYDELVTLLSEPPIGLPDECKFNWPPYDTSLSLDSAKETKTARRKLLPGKANR